MFEKNSGSLKPCKFPFVFKDEIFFSCTTIIGKNDDGSFIQGDPWCSTKVNGSDREHVSGGSHYGNCPSSCPTILSI